MLFCSPPPPPQSPPVLPPTLTPSSMPPPPSTVTHRRLPRRPEPLLAARKALRTWAGERWQQRLEHASTAPGAAFGRFAASPTIASSKSSSSGNSSDSSNRRLTFSFNILVVTAAAGGAVAHLAGAVPRLARRVSAPPEVTLEGHQRLEHGDGAP